LAVRNGVRAGKHGRRVRSVGVARAAAAATAAAAAAATGMQAGTSHAAGDTSVSLRRFEIALSRMAYTQSRSQPTHMDPSFSSKNCAARESG
jgi:hypothetical protein